MCKLQLHDAGNVHFSTHRTLSQVSHSAMQESSCSQLHCDVANCVVVKVGFREALKLLEVGVPQLLPLGVAVR